MIIDYKNKYRGLITEGTYKQLANIFQAEYFKKVNKQSYKDLDDQQKEDLKVFINTNQLQWKEDVEKITNNLYYQSWIYDVLISGEQKFPEDFDKIDQAIKDFIKISRSLKLESDQKDIKSYKTFNDLHKFIYDFKQQHSQYKPLNFDLFYQNDKYAVYKIENKNFADFSKLLTDLSVAWCVKQRNYFNNYKAPYYMVVEKSTNKPYALLHLNSHQFKDIHDRGLKDNSNEILDVLFQFPNIEYKGDLSFYMIFALKKQFPDLSDSELFCKVYKNFFVDDNTLIDLIDKSSRVTLSENMLSPFTNNGDLSITFAPNNNISFYTNSYRKLNIRNLATKCPLPKLFEYAMNRFCQKNSDGSYSVLQGIVLSKTSPYIKNGKLQIKIKNSKNFDISNCDLTTLENCPENVDGSFNCSNNKLTSLKNGPTQIAGRFNCSNNPIITLDYLAEAVLSVDCSNTSIIDLHSNSLKYVDKVNSSNNQKLQSLNINYKINELLNISNCEKLTSFNGLNKCGIKVLKATNIDTQNINVPTDVNIIK